jgi:thymidylate synthase
MNTLDKQYRALLQDILDNGVVKGDRTGTGTISVFGRQIRHKMSEGFPLLTTKKMPFKTIVTELLWFLRGDTNIKYLVDNNCHIWDGDAYKKYENSYAAWVGNSSWSNNAEPWDKENFIRLIKEDERFCSIFGELGPIYGKQWRSWKNPSFPKISKEFSDICDGRTHIEVDYPIDQIQNLIDDLKTNPDSRRLMVNAWNVGELDQMVLPPCHYGFQVYTRELSDSERAKLYWDKRGIDSPMLPALRKDIDNENIPKRAISLMWNQRSVDTFLGLPFNIASYGLLLMIIAEIVNMVPEELVGNLGDVHLYSNHIDAAKEQIGRKYSHEERLELLKEAMGEARFELAVSRLMPFGGGLSEYYEEYKIPLVNRNPFSLPSVSINTEFWCPGTEEGCTGKPGSYSESFEAIVKNVIISDFQLENYVSHPKISAPLSN